MQPPVPSQDLNPVSAVDEQTAVGGHAQHFAAVPASPLQDEGPPQWVPFGQCELDEQLRGGAGLMAPQLHWPPHCPMVGAVMPTALAYVTLQ